MERFEIGRTYAVASACDHNCLFEYTVTARTAATLKLVDKFGHSKLCRINSKVSEWNKAETVFPEGRYSMCPVLSASDAI